MAYIIAHRGASAEAPENTIPAINKAIALNVDFIEFDIRLSRNGTPFVFHDPTACRTLKPGKRLLITDLYSSHIKTFDAGKWFGMEYAGFQVPTLLEILMLERGKAGLMIEIKEEHVEPKVVAKAVMQTLDIVGEQEYSGPTMIGSFSPEILHAFQKISKNVHLIGILKNMSKISHFLKLGLKHLAVKHTRITEADIARLLKLGITVWSYTIDDVDEAHKLINWGVSGIITNDPRKLLNNLSIKDLNSPPPQSAQDLYI